MPKFKAVKTDRLSQSRLLLVGQSSRERLQYHLQRANFTEEFVPVVNMQSETAFCKSTSIKPDPGQIMGVKLKREICLECIPLRNGYFILLHALYFLQ